MRLAAAWLRSARRILIFTGAGISAESGIPTFRDGGGFWNRFAPEEFAKYSGLKRVALREPARLAEFISCLVEPIAKATPSPGHRAIADMERHRDVTVVTQNIDELHQEAGSTLVREIHGSLFDIRSSTGRFLARVTREELLDTCAKLRRAMTGPMKLVRFMLAVRRIVGLSGMSLYRPDIVLFGERLREPEWTLARKDATQCDLLLVVGTSGMVWPAAELPDIAHDAGAKVIEVDPSPGVTHALHLQGGAGEVLPALVAAAFSMPDAS